jgi:putative DNA methylase
MGRPSLVNSALAHYPTIKVSRLALREGNSKRPVYTMHKWWARRLGAVFRMILLAEQKRYRPAPGSGLWKEFYGASRLPQGFTVLDPFLGGGTTLIEASKQGANCIGVDIDPVACFITQMELAAISPRKIVAAYLKIDRKLRASLGRYYRTTRGRSTVDVVHYFWVDSVDCPTCRSKTDAHPTYQLLHNAATRRQTIVCPKCDLVADKQLRARWHQCKCGQRTDLRKPPVAKGIFTCPSCKSRAPIACLSSSGRLTPRLFALEYMDQDGARGFQRAIEADVARYRRARRTLTRVRAALPFPRAKIPTRGRFDRRPIIFGNTTYASLFNARQLLGLGTIAKAIAGTKDRDVRRALALALSHALASNNMLCGWAFGYRRLTPLFGVHAFRKVTRPVEANILGLDGGRGSFANAVRAVVRGYKYMESPFEYDYDRNKPIQIDVSGPSPTRHRPRILNRSSTDLSPIRDNSVHLVLTDPPYFDNLSYSELSDFYHVWLRRMLGRSYIGRKQRHTPIGKSLFAGKRRGLNHRGSPQDRYAETLKRVFVECRRVVREDGALVFTFHHRSPEAWACLGTALLGAGFSVERVVPVRSEGQSGFHSYDGTLKWDAIFFCAPASRRPKLVPDSRALAQVRASALRLARTWTTRIRKSRLAFSDADMMSLKCALMIGEFSRRSLSAASLGRVLGSLDDAEVRSSLGRPHDGDD